MPIDFAAPMYKIYVDGAEDVSQRVLRRSQYLTGRLGYPLGEFFKVAAIGDVAWNAYGNSSEARNALEAQNAVNGTSAFVLQFDRVFESQLLLELCLMGWLWLYFVL